jgi:hypothetical protein
MVSISRSRFFRECLAFFFVSAALIVGCYGVLLLFSAFDGHGNPVGNAFIFGLGLFLLVFSPVVLILGLINWRKAHPRADGADS